MLYVVGDSHALYCFAGVEDARIYWVGPRLMHRVARDGLSHLLPRSFRPRAPDDRVILVFGEIDCRVHIGRVAREKNISIEAVVDELVAGYAAAVRTYMMGRKRPLLGVAGVMPGCVGSEDEDVRIRAILNDRLRVSGLPFLDLHKALGLGPLDRLPEELSDDGTHINPFFNERILKAVNRLFRAGYRWRAVTRPVLTYAYAGNIKRLSRAISVPTRTLFRRLRGKYRAPVLGAHERALASSSTR